ncbi:MAG: M23 family metallopeptidase [bacterium]|nr:M23 family metallopeptidase [bacterium]
MSDRFLVKVIPPRGYAVYRLELARRHLYLGAASLCGLVVLVVAGTLWDVHHLRAIAEEQRRQLAVVDRQARALDAKFRHIQRQNVTIRAMIGLKPEARPSAPVAQSRSRSGLHELAYRGGSETTQMRLASLAELARSVGDDESRLQAQTARMMAQRRAEEAARARALAAIPSIMPAQGPIDSPFGYRSYPDREFHDGVDIAADYGSPVVAAANGIVASAGWDGGYGIKVDIDHGNGYHTWYAHLSRTLVHAGEPVTRGKEIGLVGATGFATGPHLHYQLMLDGRALDPAPFLHGVPQDVIASIK